MQTIEPVLRARSRTGLQKAATSPPYSVESAFYIQQLDFNSTLLAFTHSRHGQLNYHSSCSETSEPQHSKPSFQIHRPATQLL